MNRAVLVTGGAGFLGSHLCERLLNEGKDVVCLDDLSTGSRDNLSLLLDRDGFRFIEADVRNSLDVDGPFDLVFHLASAASPPAYLQRPIETLEAGSVGTKNALDVAATNGARFVLTSTSEIYGDPEMSPQTESYRGSVSCTGPRSVYDEAKRYAEAMTMAYRRTHGVDTGIVRIFNTYGPRMSPEDGRAVTDFIARALRGEDVHVFGDGSQTRSFCFVDDLIEGLYRFALSDHPGPVNLGNPQEITILDLAKAVVKQVDSGSGIDFKQLPEDDPRRRCPDISLAREVLDWEPAVSLDDGLAKTIDWHRGL